MPPEFTLFLDENIHRNRAVVALLAELDVRTELYGSYFAPGVADAVWLAMLRERGWLPLTADKRIRYRLLELRAVEENGVGLFCFTQNSGSAVMVAALRLAMPKMRKIAERQPKPFIATISQAGAVEVRQSFGRGVAGLR